MSRKARIAMLEVVEAHLDEYPDEWTATQFELTNLKRGVVIWIANGAYALSVKLHGADVALPFGWKRRLRRAVDKWLARQLIAQFRTAA